MNIIQSVIFLLVAIIASAQVIYQNQSPPSENAHEMEQRVLLEVKQHLHDFLDKFRTEVQDMKGKQQALKQLVDQVNMNTYAADILSLKSSVSDMKTEILGVRNDGIRLKSGVTNVVNTLNSRVNTAKNNMDILSENVSSLFSEVRQAQASHARLSTDVQSVKGKQESLKQRVDQINTNKYTSDITGLKVSVSSLQTEITGVKNDGNSIRTRMKNDYNTLNRIGLHCSWTSWQNSVRLSFSYRTRTGYIIRGVYSYYCSINKDRRFKFLECC